MSGVRSSVGCAGIEVRRFDLDLEPEVLAALRATLSADERARADRFRFARDTDRFTAGRGLLRAALAERLNEAPHALCFGYGPAGKPFLRDHPRTRFNVSGAAGAGLLAVADEIELGVDLELASSAQLVVEVADRYFAPAELEALALLEPSQRPLACLRCWTRKEAYVKARGDGLGLPLDEFAVSLGPAEPAALQWCAAPGEAARWSLIDVSDPAGVTVAALCYAAAPDAPCDVTVTVVEGR